MGAGVQIQMRGGPASLGLPSPTPLVSIHRSVEMDDDAGVSLINFTAPASSHEDDDTKESDGWKLHSDASTMSSRVTTPDPISPSPLLPSFASISSRISPDDRNPAPRLQPSSRAPLPPPAPLYQVGGMERTKGRSRRYPRNQNRASRRRSSPARVSQLGPTKEVASCQINRDQVPSLPAPLTHNCEPLDGLEPKDITDQSPKRCSRGQTRVLGGNVKVSKTCDMEGDGISKDLLPQAALPRTLVGALPLLPRPKSREKSLAPPAGEGSSSSESSDVDPIAYRNRWQFPPQLPAGPGPAYGSSIPRSRSSKTNQITAWVSRFEQSQSPERSRLVGGISFALQPTDTESRRDGTGSQHSGDSSHGEIESLWQQLKVRRAKVETIRAEMRILRRELRDIRREKDAADNAFMSVVRPMLVPQGSGPRHASTDLVDSKLERMQRLRDDYQVLESSYENLESKLDSEECELGILETQFFGLLATGQTTTQPRADVRREPGEAHLHVVSDIPFDLRGISPDGPAEESHPLYAELMSAIGNLENAKEEYEDLHCVKEQYELDYALRRSAGRQDLNGMKEFLSEYPSEQQRMKEAIGKFESQVRRLKLLCEKRKVMKKHLSVGVEYALDPRIKYEDIDLDDRESILRDRHSLAHPEFRELLSQPDHLLAEPEPLTPLGALKAATMLPNQDPAKVHKKRLAAKEYAIESLMRDCDGGKKADYVNRWLLHQLRLSPLNAVLLRSTFLASRSLKIRDLWRWQCDVMHYWWRDKTMSLTNSFFDNHVTYSELEYSSRVGTPQLSRAASDGGRPKHGVLVSLRQVDGDDAVTVDGCS